MVVFDRYPSLPPISSYWAMNSTNAKLKTKHG